MMRTTFVLFASCTVALASLACGGESATDIPDTGTDVTNPPNDSSVNNDVNNPPPNDSGPTPDGPITTSDGGSTPGTIQCGTNVCNVPAQQCCVRFQADGGADGGFGLTRTCTAPNGCQNGAVTSCDEKADCPNNQVCCVQFGGNSITASCQNNCGNQGVQLCKTTAECTNDGGVCTQYTCANNPVQSCRKPFPQCTP